MAVSPALEILAWMERGVLAVLHKHQIEPDTPNRMRRAATAADAKQAAFILEHIYELRVARDPDTAARLALVLMFAYMDGRERFGWAAPRLKGSRKGGLTNKQKADKFWQPWEERYAELRGEGLTEHKARQVIDKEMNPDGEKRLRSMSAITGRLKN